MSFFVSKVIESRLDEATFISKDDNAGLEKHSSGLEVNLNNQRVIFKIKKLIFFNEDKKKYLVKVSLHVDDVGELLSNKDSVKSIKLSKHTIHISHTELIQIEESNKIDEYVVDITCYSA